MIVYNAAKCRKCGDVIASLNRHDFRMCSCNSIGVDGGNEYIRRIGHPSDIEELSVYSNSPFNKIREVLHRFNVFTKKYVPLKDIDNDWLDNILDWYTPPSNKGTMSPDYWLIYLREKQHRVSPNWE